MVSMNNNKISNILVAVDFSEESNKALKFSLDLATQLGDCKIEVITAVRPIPSSLGDLNNSTVVTDDRDINEVKEELAQVIKRLKGDSNVEIEQKVELGYPVDVIVGEAEKKMPDIIIMGNKKHGFKRGILTGSVSERVSANSPVSVMIVR